MNEIEIFFMGLGVGITITTVIVCGCHLYRRTVRGIKSNDRCSSAGADREEELRGRLEETSTSIQDDFRGLDDNYTRTTELIQKARDILDNGKHTDSDS